MKEDIVENKQKDYNEKRGKDDINLINEVREHLVKEGLEINIKNNFDNNSNIIACVDKIPEVQRLHLNAFLSEQMMYADNPAINERYALIPDGTIEDWLKLFKEVVTPFLVKNELPKQITFP